MGQEGTLVPARFLTMMGHLLATIMFLYCRSAPRRFRAPPQFDLIR